MLCVYVLPCRFPITEACNHHHDILKLAPSSITDLPEKSLTSGVYLSGKTYKTNHALKKPHQKLTSVSTKNMNTVNAENKVISKSKRKRKWRRKKLKLYGNMRVYDWIRTAIPLEVEFFTMHMYEVRWSSRLFRKRGRKEREGGSDEYWTTKRFKSNEKKGLNRFSSFILVIANLRHDFTKLTFKVLRVIQVKMVQLYYMYQFIKTIYFSQISRFGWPFFGWSGRAFFFTTLIVLFSCLFFHSRRKIIFHSFIWLPFASVNIQRQLTDGT